MNPYQVLGLLPDANKDEIRKAYKKLALKNHPDKGGDPDTFRNITAAYETLIKEDEQPMRRLNDHHHTVTVTLDDVHHGKNIKLKLVLDEYDRTSGVKCAQCNGTGHIQMGPMMMFGIVFPCPLCQGSKMMYKVSPVEKTIEFRIESDIEDGAQIVFDDMGQQPRSPHETPGNLVIEVRITNHTMYKRLGRNLVYTPTISLCDALVGTVVSIPYFGDSFEFDTHEIGIINPDRSYIVPGRGLGNKGEMILKFRVIFPDGRILMRDEAETIRKIIGIM